MVATSSTLRLELSIGLMRSHRCVRLIMCVCSWSLRMVQWVVTVCGTPSSWWRFLQLFASSFLSSRRDRTGVCVFLCACALGRSARFSGYSLHVIPQAHGGDIFYYSPRAFDRLDEIAPVCASYHVRMLLVAPHHSVGSHCM
jgi:hypothetical protein